MPHVTQQKSQAEIPSSKTDVVSYTTSPSSQDRQLQSQQNFLVIDSDNSTNSSASRFSDTIANRKDRMGTGNGSSTSPGASSATISSTRERRPNTRKRKSTHDEVEVVVRNDSPAELLKGRPDIFSLRNRTSGQHDPGLLDSNLKHVSPKINMPLEICDNDLIWSAAKITKISNKTVTVRYEGWGSEWDEEISYPNQRLARIFTYTKRVKCLALILKKKKNVRGVNTTRNNIRNWTDAWPCTVSFRMPHPVPHKGSDDGNQFSPASLLRRENKVFVQPYASHLLSSSIQKSLKWGGWWISAKNLRTFKDFDIKNPLSNDSNGCVLREIRTNGSASQIFEYHFSNSFREAYNVAKFDIWIRGCLPAKVISEGSLVDERFRVQDVGGDSIGGVKYTGQFSLPNDVGNQKSEASSRVPSPMPSPKPVENTNSIFSVSESSLLPSPIKVKYEHPGVRRLSNSNRWASVVKLAGNDVFLGTFVSQTDAVNARKQALMQCINVSTENLEETESLLLRRTEIQHEVGNAVDLITIPVEAVVQAFEESKEKTPSFSLSKWVAENKEYSSS